MGWDSSSSWSKKSDAVRETLADYARNGYKVHAHASTAQGLYLAVTTPQNVSLILCYLISVRGGEVMRKGMSEEMGPVMNDCPLALLDFPSDYVNHEYASKWRESVRAFHASKAAAKAKAKAIGDLTGKTVEVYGKRYQVLEKHGRGYRALSHVDGRVYKMGPKVIGALTVISQ